MELLNKFENIEIKNDTRVPEEDLKVIEGYAKEFTQYRVRFLKLERVLKGQPLNPPTYGANRSYSDLEQEKVLEYFYKEFMKDSQTFIEKIIYYFKTKYQIELDNNFEKKDYGYTFYRLDESEERLNFYKNLTHDTVLNDIFQQLGGFDFNSKAEQEIKENIKDICTGYAGKSKIKLSKNKVAIQGTGIITYDKFCGYKLSYYTRDRVLYLINALNHFENNNTEITELNNMLCYKNGGVKNDFTEEFLFEKHELNFNKIKSFKFFKNGRVDIEFTSGQYALEFARDYCGYID